MTYTRVMLTSNYRAGSAAALATLGIESFSKVAVSPEWIQSRITNAVQKGVTNRRVREFENSVFDIADRAAAKRSLNPGDGDFATRAALIHDKATAAGLDARRLHQAAQKTKQTTGRVDPLPPLPTGEAPMSYSGLGALLGTGVGLTAGGTYLMSKDKTVPVAPNEPDPAVQQSV